MPVGPLWEAAKSPWIETVAVPRGGHLGFLAARNGDADFRWLDWRILDWLREGHSTEPIVEQTVDAYEAQSV